MQENGTVGTQTEDDLFRVLARPSFDEIRRMHSEHKRLWRATHATDYPSTENIRFMKYHGWTWLEFLNVQHHRNLPARLI